MPGDVGIGLIVAALAVLVLGAESSWQLFGLSVAGALLPDVDAVYHAVVRGSIHNPSGQQHRQTPLHRPLTLVLILGALYPLFAVLHVDIATYVAFCVSALLHLCHDLFWTGWGIQVLAPFDWRSFSYRSIDNEPPHWHALTVEQLADYVRPERYHDADWVVNMYLKFKKEYRLPFIVELLLFFLGIFLAATALL